MAAQQLKRLYLKIDTLIWSTILLWWSWKSIRLAIWRWAVLRWWLRWSYVIHRTCVLKHSFWINHFSVSIYLDWVRRKIVMVMSLGIRRPAILEILEILENLASLASLANLASPKTAGWVVHKMMKVIVVVAVAAAESVANMFVVVHSIGMALYYL